MKIGVQLGWLNDGLDLANYLRRFLVAFDHPLSSAHTTFPRTIDVGQ
jgi:hypothetical protein